LWDNFAPDLIARALAAAELNRRNVATVTGKRWQATQIIRARGQK
jgi:hypothetical protein